MLFLSLVLTWEERRQTNVACSITANNCGFSGAANAQFPLAFGSKCTLNLTNCKVDACYGIIDWSYNMRWAYTEGLSLSAFETFTMQGVRVLNWSSAGVYFRPSSPTVTMTFTVQTCDNFYKLHPYETQESCAATSGPRISAPIRGPPLCGSDTMEAFGQPL